MDLSKIKDLKDLEALIDLMGRHGLAELELEGGGQKIRLRWPEPQVVRSEAGLFSAAQPVVTRAAEASLAASSALAAAEAAASLHEVTSPLVGTFYRASSPEAEPFVKEGDAVGPDQVLCIIEAMKVMNEIPAGVTGVVREILVKNGESVQFGQSLFRIEVE